MGSRRWSPTHEQLMILQQMYENGVQTPKTTKIQQIAAHLSRYGKIEGKNVFYWFQNRKARERQRLRKKFQLVMSKRQWHQQQFLYCHNLNQETHVPSLHHFCSCSPTFLPPQGIIKAVNQEDSSGQQMTMNNSYYDTWQVGVHSRDEEEKKPVMRISDQDHHLNMIKVDPPSLSSSSTSSSSWCHNISTTRRSTPLETLQLFPTTALN